MENNIRKTFYFDTGVKYSVYPKLSKGQIERNGTVQIPFECEDVPDNAVFHFACDNPALENHKNMIVREIFNSTLCSKYAYFTI